MNITTAYSTKGSVDEVVQDLKGRLAGFEARLLLFFASSAFDPDRLARQIKEAFPSARSLGCTTAGEIVSGQMLKNSVVAMAFGPKAVADVRVEVLRNIRRETPVKEAFASFEKHYGQKMSDLDSKKYVGLILVDGLSGAEERIMETIGDLTDVTFIGGSLVSRGAGSETPEPGVGGQTLSTRVGRLMHRIRACAIPVGESVGGRATNLVDRSQKILLSPKQEWQVIDGQAASVGGLYAGYIIPLGAIGPVAFRSASPSGSGSSST